jgi:hypothetical protein
MYFDCGCFNNRLDYLRDASDCGMSVLRVFFLENNAPDTYRNDINEILLSDIKYH